MRVARLICKFALLLLPLCAIAADKSVHSIGELPPEASAAIWHALERSRSVFPEGLQQRQASSPPTEGPWVQLAQPVASPGHFGEFFGTSVGVSGNIVVISQLYTGIGNGNGEALVFLRPATGAWNSLTPSAILVPSDGASTNLFGSSLAISGNTIVVGSPPNPLCPICNPGRAYVYVEPAGGWSGILTETAELTASDAASGSAVGTSVSISGNTVVVGAPGEMPGAAYVFVKPASGWVNATETAKLTSSDGLATDQFGTSVSISGNNIVVGAPNATGSSSQTGAAYIFTQPAGGWTDMTQTAKLTASDGASYDQMGFSVASSGGTIVAGAPYAAGISGGTGSAYIFVEPAGGWSNSTQTAKLIAPDGETGDTFGSAVAIANSTVAAGAPQRSRGPLNFRGYPPWWKEGGVYVFAKSGSGWTQTSVQVVNGTDARNDDLLGASVAISGDLVVGGAPYLGKYAGAAFVFTKY